MKKSKFHRQIPPNQNLLNVVQSTGPHMATWWLLIAPYILAANGQMADQVSISMEPVYKSETFVAIIV